MNFYQSPNLIPQKHAFFGKNGGFSQGIYESLNFNIKSQDDPQNIAQNMQKIAQFYNRPAHNIVRLLQNHTNDAVFIDQPSQYEVSADAVITNNPNLVLGITTADCTPLLLADYQTGIVAAAHAGWRGTLYGIVENTIDVMLRYGAKIENIVASTGPCLQQFSFEVGNDMRSLFLEQNPDLDYFFEPKEAPKGFWNKIKHQEEKFLCDIEGIIEYKLRRMGIEDISLCRVDTLTNPDSLFSYRRNMQQGLIKQTGDFPIQLSTICL